MRYAMRVVWSRGLVAGACQLAGHHHWIDVKSFGQEVKRTTSMTGGDVMVTCNVGIHSGTLSEICDHGYQVKAVLDIIEPGAPGGTPLLSIVMRRATIKSWTVTATSANEPIEIVSFQSDDMVYAGAMQGARPWTVFDTLRNLDVVTNRT